jgi:hypothetical protein
MDHCADLAHLPGEIQIFERISGWTFIKPSFAEDELELQ